MNLENPDSQGAQEYKPPRVPDTLRFFRVKMYAELGRKKCLKCKEDKSLELFRFRERKNGRFRTHESYCKACEKEDFKRWYALNTDKLKLRDYERNCARFGLTVVQYEQMVKKQDGKCAICLHPEVRTRSGVVKKLAIDHCHQTGKIRALLCCDCNTAIGLFKENEIRIKSALQYIRKFKK